MVLPPHERGNRGLTLPLLPVQPAEEAREREEEEERSSVAELTASTTATTTPVAAATAASFSAGGAGAVSGSGGAGSSRSRMMSVPLKLLGAAAEATEEGTGSVTDTTGGTRTYGWNSETKCVRYSTDGGKTWTDVAYKAEQSNDTLTGVTGSGWTSDVVFNIKENTTLKLGKLPAKIQAEDDNGNVATGAHVSIKVIGNSIYENSNPVATDFIGIDTVHIGAMTDENGKSHGLRLRMASAANTDKGFSISTFLEKSSNTLFVGGGQLWLYNYSAASSAVAVYSSMYLGGCLYDDSDSKYSHRGLDGDIRAGHTVNFFNTIHLIEDARILGIDEGSASAKGVTFTDSCRIYGNGYDLSLGSPDLRDTDLSDYKGTPFAIAKGCVIEGVKSLVVGGVPKVAGDKYGSTTVNIAGTVKAGSLRVGRGSTVNIADNVDHLYFSNKGADYDAHDYALLLLKDATDTSGNYYAKINFADKATISCNTDKLTDKDGTVIGQFVGAFAMDVKDGKMTISGGKSAEDEGNSGTSAEDGNFGEKTSAVENLKLELRTGSALVLNDIVLGVYHNLQGYSTQHNALGANNVTIDLSSPEYAKTGSMATTALTLKATGASEATHIVAVGSDVLTIDYTGMSNLTFDEGGTLLLDASSLAVNMSLYDYVAVKFDKSVELSPDKMASITANNGQAIVQTYYIKDGDNYYVYFRVPEPASGLLCLFGLAVGAAGRRRKQAGRA
ncbi:MAG: PEP-CTERM sorting domain-containing protein [Akkermansia muciniphila]|nr:PEP-CTERM sorting domain-containing protein [Akkermansia muciniphila]